MKRFLIFLFCIFLGCIQVFAAKIPTEVKEYVFKIFPNADIRFDGVIILPNNTVYLPLYPSLFSDIENLKIKQTIPSNKDLKDEPDVVIFNNDFVLMKVINTMNGTKTLAHINQPPLQVRTGLLPQDMLVPSGLIIPENIKGIIGNLKIDTLQEDIIKVENHDTYESFLLGDVPNIKEDIISQLKNKILYVTTNISKNIQVMEPGENIPKYALVQKSIPIDVKAINNGKILLVATYDRPFLDVISVADSRFIKQIGLDAVIDEILLDENNKKAYVTSPQNSNIFVIDTETMSLEKKITVNGYCENLILRDNKIFYVDKLKNNIWAIELNNSYLLKNIGSFPNVSSIEFIDNKLYLSSRTKSRVAVVDYETLGLVNEFTTVNKPIKMCSYKNILYVLGAQNNVIQKIDTTNNRPLGLIELKTEGFSSGFNKINDSNLAIVTDLKTYKYSIIDLSKGKLLKTYSINVPIKDIIIVDKIKLFE